MLLSEMPHFSIGRPITVFARHRGRYTRPVEVVICDLRAEDHGYARVSQRWVAKLPTEDRYLVFDGVIINHSATKEEAMDYVRQGFAKMPDTGPNPWWIWIEGHDADYNCVKAASKPRPTDTCRPETTDEAQSFGEPSNEPLAVRLERALNTRSSRTASSST
jgi:hypothetical protein